MQRFIEALAQVGPDDFEVRIGWKRRKAASVVVVVSGPAEEGSEYLLAFEPLVVAAANQLPGAWRHVGHDVSFLGVAAGEPLVCSYYFAKESDQ